MSDTYLEKVRKLLTQAENSGATEAEREVFRAKAYELMAREQLTEAMVRGSKVSADDVTCAEVPYENPFGNERMSGIANVARAFGCKPVVTQTNRTKQKGYVTICGIRRDVEACQLTLASLGMQLPTALKRHTVPTYLSPWEKYVDKRSFVEGWFAGVCGQVRAANDATRKSVIDEAAAASGEDVEFVGKRMELALRDAKTQVDDFIDKKYGKLYKLRGGAKVGSGNGYGSGRTAGSKASVGGSRSFSSGPKGLGSGS